MYSKKKFRNKRNMQNYYLFDSWILNTIEDNEVVLQTIKTSFDVFIEKAIKCNYDFKGLYK